MMMFIGLTIMKNYSLDTNDRHIVFFFLAVVSVGISLAILPFVEHSSQIVLKLAAPDAMALFGILVWLFDKKLWRSWLFNSMTRIPVLDGRWKGTLTRIGQNGEANITRQVALTI